MKSWVSFIQLKPILDISLRGFSLPSCPQHSLRVLLLLNPTYSKVNRIFSFFIFRSGLSDIRTNCNRIMEGTFPTPHPVRKTIRSWWQYIFKLCVAMELLDVTIRYEHESSTSSCQTYAAIMNERKFPSNGSVDLRPCNTLRRLMALDWDFLYFRQLLVLRQLTRFVRFEVINSGEYEECHFLEHEVA
jgi:hypothetical protein